MYEEIKGQQGQGIGTRGTMCDVEKTASASPPSGGRPRLASRRPHPRRIPCTKIARAGTCVYLRFYLFRTARGLARYSHTPLGVFVWPSQPETRRDCVSCSHSRLEVPRQLEGSRGIDPIKCSSAQERFLRSISDPFMTNTRFVAPFWGVGHDDGLAVSFGLCELHDSSPTDRREEVADYL